MQHVSDLPDWAQVLIKRVRSEAANWRDKYRASVSRLDAANRARIARIPEPMRALCPTDYTPEQLADWLDANENRLTQ